MGAGVQFELTGTDHLFAGLQPFVDNGHAITALADLDDLVLTPSIEQSLNGTQLYISQPDPGNVTLNLQYCDTSGSTTDVHFVVKYASNMTVKVDQDLGNPGIICVLANDTHKNIRGQGYYYYWNASRSV